MLKELLLLGILAGLVHLAELLQLLLLVLVLLILLLLLLLQLGLVIGLGRMHGAGKLVLFLQHSLIEILLIARRVYVRRIFLAMLSRN